MNASYTTLAKNPELYPLVLKLIEESFHYPKEHSFETDFYPLMNPLNYKNCHLLIDEKEGNVIAHIGASLREFGNNHLSLPICSLGGIAVANNYRGQGHFAQLFERVITQYERSRALFLLWSNLDQLYEKYHFYQAGSQGQSGQKNFSFSHIAERFEKKKFNTLTSKEFSQIQALYKEDIGENFTSFIRDEASWSALKGISSTDIYIYKTDENILAYLLIGKGHDLPEIIHEFVAHSSIKDELLNELLPYKLWYPSQSLPIKPLEIFYLGLFKVANYKLFFPFIEKWSNDLLKIKGIEHNHVSFSYEDKSYHCHESDFLRFIFGPYPQDQKALGMPFYLSGLDSV